MYPLETFQEIFEEKGKLDNERFELFCKIYQKHQSKVPIDLVQFAQEACISIFLTTSMNDDESGAIVKDSSSNDLYSIYINKNHSPNRRAFTLAHELGHFFCDRDYLEKNGEIVESLMRSAEPLKNPDLVWREIRANKFAAELLMPRESFLKIWETSSTPEEVANKFNVSVHAAKVRASSLLGVIPPQ